MKFYDFKPAPNPRRVRIFMAEKSLAEKGSNVEIVQVDLPGREHMSPTFLKKNPLCDVPVLELDDGTCISQVSGICRYLEAAFPEPSLYGKTAKEQGLIAMWDNFAVMQGVLAVTDAFRNSVEMFKGRATLGAKGYEQIPALAERGFSRTYDSYENLNGLLGAKEFVAGDQFSIADITTIVAIDFAKVINIVIDDEHVNLKRWYDAVSKRPSMVA
jgi:glutathione S-transferase